MSKSPWSELREEFEELVSTAATLRGRQHYSFMCQMIDRVGDLLLAYTTPGEWMLRQLTELLTAAIALGSAVANKNEGEFERSSAKLSGLLHDLEGHCAAA